MSNIPRSFQRSFKRNAMHQVHGYDALKTKRSRATPGLLGAKRKLAVQWERPVRRQRRVVNAVPPSTSITLYSVNPSSKNSTYFHVY